VKIDTIILADAVSTPPDGKFYIHGGGFSRYEVPMLPFPIPLGVLIRLKIEEGDLDRPHHFRVALVGPTGNPNVPPIELEATAPPDVVGPAEGEERFANIALHIPAVAVRDGLYHLEVHVEDELERRIPLPVMVAPGGPRIPAEPEWPEQAGSGPSAN
jgi:hypothetical protein